MDELYDRLQKVPDTYSGFIFAVMNYAKMEPGRLQVVMKYLIRRTSA